MPSKMACKRLLTTAGGLGVAVDVNGRETGA